MEKVLHRFSFELPTPLFRLLPEDSRGQVRCSQLTLMLALRIALCLNNRFRLNQKRILASDRPGNVTAFDTLKTDKRSVKLHFGR